MNRNRVELLGILVAAAGALLAWGCAREGTRTEGSGARVAIAVTDSGFVPATATVPAGESVTLVVTRETDQTCAKEIVFPGQNIRKELPLGKAVEITLTPTAKGELPYTCGMSMLSGKLVVE